MPARGIAGLKQILAGSFYKYRTCTSSSLRRAIDLKQGWPRAHFDQYVGRFVPYKFVLDSIKIKALLPNSRHMGTFIVEISCQIACCSCCGSPLTVRLRQTTTRSLKMHLPPCKTDPSEGTLRKAHHFGTSHGLALKMFSVRDEFSNSCEHCVAVHSRNLRHFGSSSAIQRDANAQSAALPPMDPSDQRKSSMDGAEFAMLYMTP